VLTTRLVRSCCTPWDPDRLRQAIVGGSAVGRAVAVPGTDLTFAIVIGALGAILSVVVYLRWQRRATTSPASSAR
jgi:hypothetical protein